MDRISINDLVESNIHTGNTIDCPILVEDTKNKVTLMVRPIPLDCGGTIDWSCIIGYKVYICNGEPEKFDYENFIGSVQFMSKRGLRRLYTKTLPLVIYNNPYGGETDMLRKRINPNSKNFSGNLNGYYTFTWSACCGATFCLHHYEDGTYELDTSAHPDDCWDWSEIEDFKVEV